VRTHTPLFGRDRESPSLTDLVFRLFGELGRLVDQRLALLRAELKAEVADVGRNFALLVAGAVVAIIGAAFLLSALALWVGDLVDSTPGGFAIIGGIVTLAGGIAFRVGARDLAELRFAPKTVRELRRDVEWIKDET
jgi:Putative Actinobacterial Holin-X, holin superfamily III